MADVLMPQMGESIAEGTIVRWLKAVGDRVDADEPLFEISTDKVDAEIPSPAAGFLTEIRAKAGETVPVFDVVGVIGDRMPELVAPPVSTAVADLATDTPRGANTPEPAVWRGAEPATQAGATPTTNPPERVRLSPVVRRMVQEHRIDVAHVPGTGSNGRITKRDIVGFLEGTLPTTVTDTGARRTPMSVMRRKIAEHMVVSRRTSAHVHSVYEIDYSRIATVRRMLDAEYQAAGVKLTYMAFYLRAVASALRAVPTLNSSIDGETIVHHAGVHVGIAVAIDGGLIVPVIHHADRLSLLDAARAIDDIATRARTRKLTTDDVQGGTFTITNPGRAGSLFGMPIINQPQVGILAVGTVEKRVAVVDDAIGIRLKGYLTLGYDHRLVDGVVADEFMSLVRHDLETVPGFPA